MRGLVAFLSAARRARPGGEAPAGLVRPGRVGRRAVLGLIGAAPVMVPEVMRAACARTAPSAWGFSDVLSTSAPIPLIADTVTRLEPEMTIAIGGLDRAVAHVAQAGRMLADLAPAVPDSRCGSAASTPAAVFGAAMIDDAGGGP